MLLTTLMSVFLEICHEEPCGCCYPDGVVLAAGDHPPRRRSQHRDGLLVSALHGARQLAADDVLAAVTG